MTEPIFTGRCVRCGLVLLTSDEFATVDQFATMWNRVHMCQGATVVVPIDEGWRGSNPSDAPDNASAGGNS